MKITDEEKEARKKRLAEWTAWLKQFRSYCDDRGLSTTFTYIPEAASILNDLYWDLAEEYVRPLLKNDPGSDEKHLIHPYKIIAVSELAIMMAEPINVKDSEPLEKYVNAVFAWFVATQILETWNTGSSVKIDHVHITEIAGYVENIDTERRYPSSFSEEHIQWLTMLNVTVSKPFLLLAQCWRMFYISCLAVAGNGKLN